MTRPTDAPAAPKQILDPRSDDAATLNSWSDRDPATIVKRTAKTIIVQRDRVEHMSSPDHDTYAHGKGELVIYVRDYDAPLETYTLRQNGRWIRKGAPMNARGSSLTLGVRSTYRDPSF